MRSRESNAEIQFKRSLEGAVPLKGDLVPGELGIDVANTDLYTAELGTNNIKKINKGFREFILSLQNYPSRRQQKVCYMPC